MNDKVLHLLLGVLIAYSVGKATQPKYGLYAAVAFGVGKELYDHASKNGTVDSMDAIASIGGGLMGRIVFEF